MHVITKKRLQEFGRRHADALEPLHRWYKIVRAARWQSILDVRRVYPHADLVTVESGNVVTVFNVAGNKYRVIAAIHYNRQRLYLLRVLRHSEYTRNKWRTVL